MDQRKLPNLLCIENKLIIIIIINIRINIMYIYLYVFRGSLLGLVNSKV